VAEIAPGDQPSAELLSLFVAADRRGVGVATHLVEGLEGDVRRHGASTLEAVYMTGKSAVGAIERIFVKRGFPPPERMKVVLRFTSD
jgi:GNAT superfamily N-acetyltransferase